MSETADSTLSEEFKAIRRGIFDMADTRFAFDLEDTNDEMVGAVRNTEQLAAIGRTLVDFQLELANAIIFGEKYLDSSDKKLAQLHITRLRNYGDYIAWMLLNPHTINVLSTGRAIRPPSLHTQGKGLEGTFAAAGMLVDKGELPLIADVTNVIRTGDVIGCVDREAPAIIEVKTGSGTYCSPRTKRQVKAVSDRYEYLKTDESKTLVSPLVREQCDNPVKSATGVDVHMSRAWGSVDAVTTMGRETGEGWACIGQGDLVIAVRHDVGTPDIDGIVSSCGVERLGELVCPFVVGVTVTNTEPRPRIPPHVWWPIQKENAWALSESEVMLLHLVEPQQFKRMKIEGGRFLAIKYSASRSREFFGFVVEVDGEQHHVGPNMLEHVVYGFATMESVAKVIIEFIRKCRERTGVVGSPFEDVTGEKYVLI